MKIKRYIARDMKEACALIKEDLGPDAVIVSSRKIRERGIRGLFCQRKLEVTAAVEHQENDNTQEDKKQDPEIKRELGHIKEFVKKFTEREKRLNTTRGNSSIIENYRSQLRELEIHPEIIEKLLEGFSAKNLHLTEEDIHHELLKRIADMFVPVTRENQKSNILAFVGPPGVGKTTTIAKLGAQFSLFNGLDIGLITIDTFRIGAVKQLETYGEIMGVSVDVVMSVEEFKKAVKKNKRKDLVLIDTAGRPSRNSSQIAEIKSYLETVDPIDIYLVLSSETKNRDIVRMLYDYGVLNYSKLIFTKIDETETTGSILNAAYLTQTPIAYITNGQNVPDDIEAGTPELLAELILKDVIY